MDTGVVRTTGRRQILKTAVVAGPAVVLINAMTSRSSLVPRRVAAVGTPTPSAGKLAGNELGEAQAPNWNVVFRQLSDPYTGTVDEGKPPPAGMRYVGLEIEINNDSDQPLAVEPFDVRLRDAEGNEYRAGSTFGTEPRLSSRSLNTGERSRGWGWFVVPANAKITEATYIAPRPQFRLQLS